MMFRCFCICVGFKQKAIVLISGVCLVVFLTETREEELEETITRKLEQEATNGLLIGFH